MRRGQPRPVSDPPGVTVARVMALDALGASRRGLGADDALSDELGKRPGASPADRALAQELCYGVLRWRRRLDDALSQVCASGLPKDAGLLDVLRVGAYSLLFLDRIPAHAAVSTAVEAAKTRGHEHAAKFVNAALRSLGARVKELGRDAPPPAATDLRTLAAWHSFPDWMVEGFAATVGGEALPGLLAASNKPAALALRATPRAPDRPSLIELLAKASIQAVAGGFAREAVLVPDARGAVTELPGFAEGKLTIQDEAAQLVTELLDPQPGEDLLDVCAAPGGKAIHAAQLGARVTAIDADPRRIERIREAGTRLGVDLDVRAIEVVGGREIAGLEGKRYPKVLVDAPCSATGIVRRKPDVKWTRQPSEIGVLAARQLAILDGAARHVATGGRLVYAVCSLLRDEGEAVVGRFLANEKAFSLVPVASIHPTLAALATPAGYFRSRPDVHEMDGFFAAVMRRD